MKKILFFAITTLLTFNVNAQSSSSLSVSNTNAASRNTNAEAANLVAQTQRRVALSQNNYTYVGSFKVGDGLCWSDAPVPVSAVEAAALIYGGVASDYAVSVNPNATDQTTVTGTAWVDGYGEEQYLNTPTLDNFKLGATYVPGSFSAYIKDHTDGDIARSACNYTIGLTKINYVWRKVTQQITTVMPANLCGTTLQFMHSSVYATHTPGATAARYRVKNMTTNVVQYLEKFGATTHHWFQFNTLASYEYATTYLVDVELQMNGVWLGYYGAACTINSPAFSATNPIGVASLNGANCGRTLTNLHDGINATSVSGATGYRYEVTNMNTGVLLGTIERTLPWFNLSMFATRAVYGTPYSVRIAVKTTGDYGIFGATCTINTPVAVGLNAATCGLNAVNKSTSFNTTSRTAVMVYRFKVTNQTTSAEQILDRSFTWFNFGHLTAIYAANTTFSVEVAYSTGAGVFSPYSTSCTISSNGAASIAPVVVNNPTYAKGRNATYKISNFEVSAFPNPFNENFVFDLKSSSDNQVSIQVYDMIGKLIESREINFLNINNTTIGNNYPSGVYNVIVSQNNDLKTLRVIKR